MTRRRTTLKDVADAVGVHVSTVSRALNPGTRHFIRPEVSLRILDMSAALNYRPNAAALSLRTNRTMIVGVLIPDIANPVFPPIIRGIEDVLVAGDYMAMLVNTDARPGRQASQIEALVARGVDGLIVASLECEDPAVSRIAGEGLPVVAVNRRSNDQRIASVSNDDASGLRQILEHLKTLGHRHVANIAGPQTISTGKDRYHAFEQYRRELGLDPAESLVRFAERFNEAEGERCAADLLDHDRSITAIVASNDRLAVGAIGLLKSRGIACPQAMSVVGFNDMPMVDRLEPPLTTVRVQQYEVGRKAAELVLKRFQATDAVSGCNGFAPIVMPVELVVRGSTAPPAAA
jgi:LacI family transcriptional regulator